MSTSDEQQRPFDPAPDPAIQLAIDDIVPSPDRGAAIDFRISASSRANPSAGYTLWSEDENGQHHRHSTTKDHGEMHLLPFGTRLWWADIILHAPRTMRFFAARERENPTRASDYVDVVLPAVPPPEDVSARNGVLKAIVTGRARPGVGVRCRAGEALVSGLAGGDGRWQLIIDLPTGMHTLQVVTVDGVLGESRPVPVTVDITSPPHLPLLLLFPERDRKVARLTRVTGSATPFSDIQATLGDGPLATTRANAGGAWEIKEIRSSVSGAVRLRVENLSTGEVVERPIEVEYFPAWSVTRLLAGTVVDENGLVIRGGVIATGTGDPGFVIEFSRHPSGPWSTLATIGEDRHWRFEHLSYPPPAPFGPGPLLLRVAGDPVHQEYRVETQRPIILSPGEGESTGPRPLFRGTAPAPFQIVLADGTFLGVTPDRQTAQWQVELGPLAPGVHAITARANPRAEREIARRTILVLEREPDRDPAD